MKKSVIIVGLVVLIMFLVFGIFYFINLNKSSNPIDANSNPEEKTIMHKDFNTVIKSDWKEIEVSPSLYAYLPPNTSQEDINAEVISIAINFLGEDNKKGLNEIMEQGINISKLIVPDFELLENFDWENKFLKGRKIKFIVTQEGIKRENIQIAGIEYNNLYAVTYSCPMTNCNYNKVYKDLIESFKPVKAELR
jgi:hypothetical protein